MRLDCEQRDANAVPRAVVLHDALDGSSSLALDHSCQRGFLNTTDPGYPASPTVYYIDTNPACLDYAIGSSTDGFHSETRVSTQSSNPYLQFSGSFIGDYTGVAVDLHGKARVVWTDGRGKPTAITPNQDTVVGNGF